MKRLTPHSTWWHRLPHRETALTGALRRGQPWTIVASTCTRGKARSTSSPRAVRSSSSGSRLRVLATVHDPRAVRAILAYLARSGTPAPPGPAPRPPAALT
jgi:hypothetical protein